MKTTPLPQLFLLFAVCAVGTGVCAANAEADPVSIAIFDFESTDPKLREPAIQLAQLLTARISSQRDILTVERQDLARLLGEQELGASGLVNAGSAARIGQLTGARVLVTGRLFNAAGETNLVLKIMSAETSRVFGVATSYPAGGSPTQPTEKLATELSKLLREQRPALVVELPSREDRVAKIKQKLAGLALPSVTLAIPEQHLRSPVPDPAAETELGLILSQVGFTIYRGDAAARADYRITGEAFSETALRRGNLVSCRARVEVKATARSDGQVALMDRQTTVAVDVAEHVAGKSALQTAGAILAERIAEQLARARR